MSVGPPPPTGERARGEVARRGHRHSAREAGFSGVGEVFVRCGAPGAGDACLSGAVFVRCGVRSRLLSPQHFALLYGEQSNGNVPHMISLLYVFFESLLSCRAKKREDGLRCTGIHSF